MCQNLFNSKTCKYIKVVAIIMMFVHHFFAFPDWILCGGGTTLITIGDKPIEQLIGQLCKLCVCIFAFITGYGTYMTFLKRKTFFEKLKYSTIKIINLIIIYWITILCFFLPIFLYFKNITINNLLSNLFLCSTSMVYTGWYVLFYIEALLLLTLCDSIKNNSLIIDLFICFIIPSLLELLFKGNMFSHYFPIFMFGYIFAKYKFYDNFENIIQNKIVKNIIVTIALMVLVLIRLKFGDMLFTVPTITFIGPVLCYFLAIILNPLTKFKVIDKLIYIPSKYCTWFWFLHAIFHAGIVEIQKLAYFPKNPVLIILWAFLLLTPFAFMLDFIYNKIVSCIKILLKKFTSNNVNEVII